MMFIAVPCVRIRIVVNIILRQKSNPDLVRINLVPPPLITYVFTGGDNSKWLFGYSLSSDFNSAAPLWWPRVYSGGGSRESTRFIKEFAFKALS